MKTPKLLLIAVGAALFLSSCSLEKRLYTKGYHIDWLSKKERNNPSKQNVDLNTETNRTTSSVEPINTTALPKEEANDLSLATNSNTTDANNPTASSSPESYKASAHSAKSKLENTQRTNPTETKVSVADVLPKNKKLVKRLFNNKSDDQILLIILALLLPPLAMYMYEGNDWTSRCTLNLILTLLCGLPGVIHALIVILGNK